MRFAPFVVPNLAAISRSRTISRKRLRGRGEYVIEGKLAGENMHEELEVVVVFFLRSLAGTGTAIQQI